MQYWPWIAAIIFVILIFHLYKRKKQKDNGRYPSNEENMFISNALEEYHVQIAIILSAGKTSTYEHRQRAVLSDDNEVVVQIDILYQDKRIITHCYFSGKCEMFFSEKNTTFDGFNINNIKKGLQELGFQNVGLTCQSNTVHARL